MSEIINKQKGQVALIVLLVSAVMLTLGLSISKQTTVNTRIESDDELLKKAFNAAESGIEKYLATGNVEYVAPDNGSKADITTEDLGGGSVIANPDLTLAKDFAFFWLVSHDANGNLGSDYYADSTIVIGVEEGFSGLLRVDEFYQTGSGVSVKRGFYDFGSTAGIVKEGFTAEADKEVDWTLESQPILLAISPIEQSTRISVAGDVPFPIQGELIKSLGTAGKVSTEAVSSQVSILNRYQLPAFLFEAVSGNSILSN
jgi:hypothetical protein